MTDDAQLAAPPAQADRWARRRRALIPVLIALTSVLGSVAAWRASTASSAAGGFERRAFANTLAAQQESSRIETELASYEFTHARYSALEAAAAALRTQTGASGDSGEPAVAALADAYDAAAASLRLFVTVEVLPDGSLDLEAAQAEQWALAGDLADLDPTEETAAAESLRARSQRLVGLTALIIAAALFLTLAEVSRRRVVADLYWRGGLAVLAASVVLMVLVEAL